MLQPLSAERVPNAGGIIAPTALPHALSPPAQLHLLSGLQGCGRGLAALCLEQQPPTGTSLCPALTLRCLLLCPTSSPPPRSGLTTLPLNPIPFSPPSVSFFPPCLMSLPGVSSCPTPSALSHALSSPAILPCLNHPSSYQTRPLPPPSFSLSAFETFAFKKQKPT